MIKLFINPNKILKYFDFLKEKLFILDKEKDFMEYYKKEWLNKYKESFNYFDFIENIKKLKNNYINNKGNKTSETNLISILKSLNKVYLTNNIWESINSKIANYIKENKTIKNTFRDSINYIINDYSINTKNVSEKII